MEERQIQTKKILERMKIEQSNTIEGNGIYNTLYSKGPVWYNNVLQFKYFNEFLWYGYAR